MAMRRLSMFIYILFCCVFDFVKCGSRQLPISSQFLGSGAAVERSVGVVSSKCETLAQRSLEKILGAAYNPRYMSLAPPGDAEDTNDSGQKRDSSNFRPFAVDDDFESQLSDAPAWDEDHIKADVLKDEAIRKKRSFDSTPWECQAKVRWMDLGSDYFPRFIRSVECIKHDCWYGKYRCKPRSFTVKLLRKKRGKCVYLGKQGVLGLPQELKELWVWEERAVNFCCDCTSK